MCHRAVEEPGEGRKRRQTARQLEIKNILAVPQISLAFECE